MSWDGTSSFHQFFFSTCKMGTILALKIIIERPKRSTGMEGTLKSPIWCQLLQCWESHGAILKARSVPEGTFFLTSDIPRAVHKKGLVPLSGSSLALER